MDHKPVHYNLYIVLLVLVELYGLAQVIEKAVYPCPHEAAPSGGVELLHMLALSPAHHRGQHLQLCLLRQRQHLVHNLVDGLLLNLPAADGAVGDAYSGVQKPQVVVYLRHRAHSGAGVFGGGLLVDGDGRGQAVYLVHVWLLHLP